MGKCCYRSNLETDFKLSAPRNKNIEFRTNDILPQNYTINDNIYTLCTFRVKPINYYY